MRQIVWKLWKAWDFDKEEQWLNEMSAKGLALAGVSFCRYEFEECQPGAWHYRLELRKEGIRHPETQAYIRFLEEMGVRHVGTYSHWIYLALPAEQGPFELHSDTQSRIDHLKLIRNLLIPGGALCVGTGMMNVLMYLYDTGILANFVVGLLGLAVAAWALRGAWKLQKKILRMQKEQQIFE